ncbi:hypothetical protein PYCCODRAFT_1430635 [Trametes coccinea BRFM310]|uniref:DUF6534 domain-containing protein n=1 Tax=Trametes coccinea (strain BRFM310) TaxID=1353009 RepID=A0A1Y2J1V7_TRAC3|nr:hypothetical protein PYCCODRAFT_1430635 [Trametes coccinea BRFM310]
MTSTATAAAIPTASNAELAQTFGVLLIGFIFAVTLYGLTFFQTYIYYTRFPGDDRKTKYTVGLLWALDTTVTTLISHTIYHYLITDFMIPFNRLVMTRTFIAELALSGFLALVVHCYYASRIWAVSYRRTIIPAIVIALSLAAFALGFVSAAKISSESLFSRVGASGIRLTKGISGGLVAAADVLVAGSMLFYLRPTRNPGMAVPEGWYDKLVVYGVNRGTCFAIFHIIVLITLVTMPTGQVWILFHWVSNKAYVNSILSMLNFRNTHHGRGVPEEASLNQHARGSSGRTGTYMTRSGMSGIGGEDASHSVQFNVHTDTKSAEPMNIELDMVRSGYDDVDSEEIKRVGEDSTNSGGPSKPHDLERVLDSPS